MTRLRFFSVFLTICFFALPVKASSVHGVFKVVKGKVLVFNKEGKERKAKLGMKVYPKETVQTNKTSRAKIVMIDKNEINVTSNTKMIIADYKFNPKKEKKSVLLNVMYGKIRAKVKQKYDDQANKFQVKTKSAVAGVRGTDFFTSYNRRSNRTNVVTFEGRVDFGLPGPDGSIQNPVSVAAGQTSSLMSGQTPSAPIEVPRTELNRMNAATEAEPQKAPKDSGPRDRGGRGDNREPANEGEQQPESNNKESRGEQNSDGNGAVADVNADPNRGPASVDEGGGPGDGPNSSGSEGGAFPPEFGGGGMEMNFMDETDLASVDGPGNLDNAFEPPPPPPDLSCPTGNCNAPPPNICDINPQFCAGASNLILEINHNN